MKHAITLVLCTLLAGLVSCSKETLTTVPTTGSVSGTVIDSAANVVPGALISTLPASSQILSATNGGFTLTDLPPGTVTVSAQKGQLGSGTASVTVLAGKTVTAVIQLQPGPLTTGSLNGFVTDSAGSGIDAVTITTVPATQIVLTDKSGHFTIGGVPSGSYSVHASKTGFNQTTIPASVTAGKATSVAITLRMPDGLPIDGLLAYYPLDGDGLDASGNGRDLTLTGATFIPSRSGLAQALVCNGSSTVGLGTADPALNPASITISLWIKARNPDPNIVVSLLSKYVSGTLNGYTLWFTNGNVEWLYGAGQSFVFAVIDRSSIMDNGWHSVICTSGPSGCQMFFDGTLAASGIWQSSSAVTTQQHALTLGASVSVDQSFSGFYAGAVDDIRIYDHVLSSVEIKALSKE